MAKKQDKHKEFLILMQSQMCCLGRRHSDEIFGEPKEIHPWN